MERGDLAEEFGSLSDLLKARKKDLLAMPDVGEQMAGAIHDWCANSENRKLGQRLRKCGLDPKQQRRGTKLKD